MIAKFKKKLLATQQSFHVKRGDHVFILAGKDKGKDGVVRMVDRQRNRVLVDSVNIINGKERPIHISNVKLFRAESEVAG
ncbi:MAG: KOW motif-containing protein [Vampirovibrionales bacterium]